MGPPPQGPDPQGPAAPEGPAAAEHADEEPEGQAHQHQPDGPITKHPQKDTEDKGSPTEPAKPQATHNIECAQPPVPKADAEETGSPTQATHNTECVQIPCPNSEPPPAKVETEEEAATPPSQGPDPQGLAAPEGPVAAEQADEEPEGQAHQHQPGGPTTKYPQKDTEDKGFPTEPAKSEEEMEGPAGSPTQAADSEEKPKGPSQGLDPRGRRRSRRR